MPGAAVFRGANAHWPLVSQETGIPYICEKLVILGGHPGLGIGNGIDQEVADVVMKSHYPRMVARRALGAAISHYEECLYDLEHFPDVGRGGGEHSSGASTGRGVVSRFDPNFRGRSNDCHSIGHSAVEAISLRVRMDALANVHDYPKKVTIDNTNRAELGRKSY